MSKFLRLCEEHDPENLENKNAAFETKFLLRDQGILVRSEGNLVTIRTESGDVVLEVKGFAEPKADSEEDESVNAGVGVYSVDGEVEKLADKASSGLKGLGGKMFGTSAQKAKGAVKKRQKVAKDAVNAYDKGTERIRKSLRSVKQSGINKTY